MSTLNNFELTFPLSTLNFQLAESLLVPLSSPEAADAARFGPKAANLAALGHAGLPIPDGVCLDAAAYRLQLEALGLEASARGAFALRGSRGSPASRAADEARAARAAHLPGGARSAARGVAGRWLRGPAGPSRPCDRRRSSKIATARASPGSSKATSASRPNPNSSPPFARAGPRCGPRGRSATWRRTIWIRPTPRWPC